MQTTATCKKQNIYAGFLQFRVTAGDTEANLTTAADSLQELAPASPGLIMLPELWSCGFDYDGLHRAADKTPTVLSAMQKLAQKYQVLLAGSLPEKVTDNSTTAHFNTLHVVGPDGLCGTYRKQQLFAPMSEDTYFASGCDRLAPIPTPLGRLAALVCYDLRFPDLARQQVSAGADLLIISAQWPAARTEHWRTLVRARAIENQIFTLACNACGDTLGTTYGGHSMLVAPDGAVVHEADILPESFGTFIDLADTDGVRERFNSVAAGPYRLCDRDKIVGHDSLVRQVEQYKKTGKKIVFTNGCFDLLHVGHVTYLEQARKKGDLLIVGLNSDRSVKAIKGEDRPINDQDHRARMLAALGCVDYVVLFEQETPLELITSLLPDVLVKGGDWPVERIVGAVEVLAHGGTVESIALVGDLSTTGLIDRIKR